MADQLRTIDRFAEVSENGFLKLSHYYTHYSRGAVQDNSPKRHYFDGWTMTIVMVGMENWSLPSLE